MGFLVCIGCYAAGLVNVLVFIAGFVLGNKALAAKEAGAVPFTKTKEYDPIRNESLEARIDRAQNEVEAWEDRG